MTEKSWTLSVTNTVVSFAMDDKAPGRPIRCTRELTVVLKRQQPPKAVTEMVTKEQTKRVRHAAIQRWMQRVVIGLWVYGGTMLMASAAVDQILGIDAELWMYSSFVALFGSLPLFVESGKDPL